MQLIMDQIECPNDVYQKMKKYDESKMYENLFETATNQLTKRQRYVHVHDQW